VIQSGGEKLNRPYVQWVASLPVATSLERDKRRTQPLGALRVAGFAKAIDVSPLLCHDRRRGRVRQVERLRANRV
jgi:hypothetical protein